MKLTVVKETTFDSAHSLPGYGGKCARLHGHTYKLQVGVSVQAEAAPEFVLDFTVLKAFLEKQKDKYDHSFINQRIEYPSAERMAAVIWDELKEFAGKHDVNAEFVRLWETPTSFVEVRE